MREITGTLQILRRLPRSRNGNPRFALRIGGEECRTAADSSLAHCITNHDGRRVRALIGLHRGAMTIHSVEPLPDRAPPFDYRCAMRRVRVGFAPSWHVYDRRQGDNTTMAVCTDHADAVRIVAALNQAEKET